MKIKRLYPVRFRIIGLFFCVFVPLIAGLIFYSSTVMENAQKVVFDTGKSGFNIYMAMLEKEIEGIDIHLSDIILNNEEIRELNQAHSQEDTYLLSYAIKKNFSAPLKANSELLCMMIFSKTNNYFLAAYNDNYTISSIYTLAMQRQLEETIIQKCCEGDRFQNAWFHMELSGRPLYCRIQEYGDVYCIGVLDLALVAWNIEKDYGNGGKVLFFDNDKLLMGGQFVRDNSLEIPENTSEYNISGKGAKYMGIYSETEHFRTVYFMPFTISSAMLSLSERIGLICTAFLIAAVPFTFWYLKKYIINPLNSLKYTMEHISEDTLGISEDIHYNTEEFEQINDTLKRMLHRISDLKIDSYEKEIQKQKIEFQYLQLQIRPHFFFNCMKNLYGMAQSKNIEALKQSILLLSTHLRYLFTSNTDMVILADELKQCQNYVELLQYSQKISCRLSMEVEAGTEETPIPPISILTFVENSAKYAQRNGEILNICLQAHFFYAENKKYLRIEITDNGPGFLQNELKCLNKRTEIVDCGGNKHVGIYNVIHRCMFNYGSDFYITFINMNGAKINILIPLGGGKP